MSNELVPSDEQRALWNTGVQNAARRLNAKPADVERVLNAHMAIGSLNEEVKNQPGFTAIELEYSPPKIVVYATTKATDFRQRFAGGVQIELRKAPLTFVQLQKLERNLLENKIAHTATPINATGQVLAVTDNLSESESGLRNADVLAKGIDPTRVKLVFGPRVKIESLSGGEAVDNSLSCTSGFVVNGNRILNAAHCPDTSGTQYRWGGGSEGTGEVITQQCSSDAQIYSVSGSTSTTVRGTPIYGSYATFNGQVLWKYGRTTGYSTGTITGANSYYYQLGGQCDGVLTGMSFELAGATSAPGDSGGPYYACHRILCLRQCCWHS